MLFHFDNTCLDSLKISSLFSGGTIISAMFLEFSSITCFIFTILSAILFHTNSPVASAAFSTTFLETVSRASIPASSNCFLYLLANVKKPYPLTYFLVLGSIEHHAISIYQ